MFSAIRKFFGGCAESVNDGVAVDYFARAMSAKLKRSRAKGRGGWRDENEVSDEELAKQLVEHVAKGDPVDIANYCMFLHQRDPDFAAAFIRQALTNHVVTQSLPHVRELTASKQG